MPETLKTLERIAKKSKKNKHYINLLTLRLENGVWKKAVNQIICTLLLIAEDVLFFRAGS